MPDVAGCVSCSSGELPAGVADGRLGEEKNIKYKRMSSIKVRDAKRLRAFRRAKRKRYLYGEEALHTCLCGCLENPIRLFRKRRSAIYAALWSLQQGCPGEAWGDVFVGGLGQMLWTFFEIK